MNKLKIQQSQLDAIGKRLIRSKMIPSADIDAIVSNPLLFSAVAQKIAKNKKTRPTLQSRFWQTRRFAAVAGSAALMLLTVGIINFLRSDNLPVVSDLSRIPDAVPENARPVFPPQGTIEGKLSAGRALNIKRRKPAAVAQHNKVRVNAPAVTIDADGEFYPVGYLGDMYDANGGGRIIRVDLNRSSLFALGVNLPLENFDETVKADLLVGADGVTRGVRVVD